MKEVQYLSRGEKITAENLNRPLLELKQNIDTINKDIRDGIEDLEYFVSLKVEEVPDDGEDYVRNSYGWKQVYVYTSNSFDTDFSNKTTDDLIEGLSNLYYTDSRAVSAIKNDPQWKSGDWDNAYSWGDHNKVGYALDSSISVVGKTNNYNDLDNKPDLSVLEEVLVYDSFEGFPESGERDKVYIAADTGFMYRWAGTSGYSQLTDQTAVWGNISGDIENQNDLFNILSTKLEYSDIQEFEKSSELDSRDVSNRDRANHTGVQGIATIENLSDALASKVNEAPNDGKEYVRSGGGWEKIELVWGNFTGNIFDQLDLVSALDTKADDSSISLVGKSGNYSDLTNVPNHFPPTYHTHYESDITDIDKYTQKEVNDLLDGKVSVEMGMGLSEESYTLVEKEKLEGIQEGSTKNSTDAYLLDRANHTGVQGIATIDNLSDALDSKVNEAPNDGKEYVRSGGGWSELGDLTTTDLSNKTTDDLIEGVSNLYYTDSRAVSAIKNDPQWKSEDWSQAYSWGDHNNAGYALDSSISVVGKTNNYNDLDNKPEISASAIGLSNVNNLSFNLSYSNSLSGIWGSDGSSISSYLYSSEDVLDFLGAGDSYSKDVTSSRTSSSTSHVLTAKAMNDHRNSGDHDGRYVNKTGDTVNGNLHAKGFGTGGFMMEYNDATESLDFNYA